VNHIHKAARAAVAGALVAGALTINGGPIDAAVSVIGSCTGTRSLATLKSTTLDGLGKPYGLTDRDDQNVTISTKGVDTPKGSGNFGSCTVNPGFNPAPTTRQILKTTGKTFSVEADCNPADTGDTTEWPLSGQLMTTFTDLTKATAYTVGEGFTDPDNDPNTPSDVIRLHGMVVKGALAGADLAGELYFNPVYKDKTQTGEVPFPGYSFDLVNALACNDGTPNNANITALVIGDGTSPLLGLPASGITYTIGS
jgi:hypothetical protein